MGYCGMAPADMSEIAMYWHYPHHRMHMRYVAACMLVVLTAYSIKVLCRNKWEDDTKWYLRLLWTTSKG